MTSDGWEAAHPAPGLEIWQPVRGFRYTSDAFWLAGFALEVGVPGRALDLGTGSGVVAFLLASAGADVLGVDDAPHWPVGWARSRGIGGRVTLRSGGVGELATDPVPLVVANPPYFPAGSGPPASDPLRASARTESTGRLADFLGCALRHRDVGGTVALVVPAERVRELPDPAEVVILGKRALARIGGPRRPPVRLAPTDPRVLGWYRRFGARPPASAA